MNVLNKIGLDHIAYNNGVAVADFDRDNDLDILIVAHLENPDDPKTYTRLMRNNNNGTFEDVPLKWA